MTTFPSLGPLDPAIHHPDAPLTCDLCCDTGFITLVSHRDWRGDLIDIRDCPEGPHHATA